LREAAVAELDEAAAVAEDVSAERVVDAVARDRGERVEWLGGELLAALAVEQAHLEEAGELGAHAEAAGAVGVEPRRWGVEEVGRLEVVEIGLGERAIAAPAVGDAERDVHAADVEGVGPAVAVDVDAARVDPARGDRGRAAALLGPRRVVEVLVELGERAVA